MVIRCPKCGMTQMAAAVCKGCGQALSPVAPPARPVARVARPVSPGARVVTTDDPALSLDRYLFQQRILTVSEKYEIQDENGAPVLFVERPAHALRNGLALLAGVLAGFLAAALVIWPAIVFLPKQPPMAVIVLVFTVGPGAGFAALLYTIAALERKRHIAFYRDETKAEKLLEVLQDQTLALITPTFTVIDASGAVLARVSKNLLGDIFRKKWIVRNPGGAVMIVAKEDSVFRAILRRFVSQLVLLNFILCRGETDEVLGEFNKKFSIRDRYVLDLTADRARIIDRRIALAIGVLLDTGERR